MTGFLIEWLVYFPGCMLAVAGGYWAGRQSERNKRRGYSGRASELTPPPKVAARAPRPRWRLYRYHPYTRQPKARP